MARLLVVGAGGALGFEIAKQGLAEGYDVTATYHLNGRARIAKLESLGARSSQLDLTDENQTREHIDHCDLCIFTPILSLSSVAAPLIKEQRAVFFSSNNVDIDGASHVYAALREGEDRVGAHAPGSIILRPTMIYGFPGDGNISRLIGFARRSPAMLMPGAGQSLQQPVFYRDLARIALEALATSSNTGNIQFVAGPDRLSQQEIFETVRRVVGKRAGVIALPLAPFRAVAALFEGVGLKAPISSAQLNRLGANKCPTGKPVHFGKTTFHDGVTALARALDDTHTDA